MRGEGDCRASDRNGRLLAADAATISTGEAIGRLQARLQEVASEKTKEWWERYMKGAASFRGVPMPVVRSTLRSWYAEEGFEAAPAGDLNSSR